MTVSTGLVAVVTAGLTWKSTIVLPGLTLTILMRLIGMLRSNATFATNPSCTKTFTITPIGLSTTHKVALTAKKSWKLMEIFIVTATTGTTLTIDEIRYAVNLM